MTPMDEHISEKSEYQPLENSTKSDDEDNVSHKQS